MTPVVKICGLSTPETLEAALAGGADMVGFVHFPKSPRHLDLARGRALSARARGRATRVLLLVDPGDDLLTEAVAALDPDLLQLHGAETPERVAAIRARFERPVMKAVGIATRDDLDTLRSYAEVADRLLVDAKPPRTAGLPGGNGLAFDWTLLAGLDLEKGFMLSGGLTPENVADGIALTGAAAVDVSSGVETAPGQKCPDRITAFIRAARAGASAASAGFPRAGH